MLLAAMCLLVACGTPTPSASETSQETLGFSQTPIADLPVETAAPVDAGTVAELPTAEPPAGEQASTTLKNDMYSAAPAMVIDPNKTYIATIETNKGTMKAELYAKDAPITVNNFVTLARDGFYDGIKFHRIINGFMVQTGDPTGTGSGGPGYSFKDEPVTREYVRGTLAMANAGPDTNGSQFFIVHADYPLDKKYTIFGKVTEGLDTLDAIANVPVSADPNSGENSVPTEEVMMTKVTIEEK
jgi:cyclophilin family peptidyl-prolyl cis-trans isomerase